MNTIKVKNIAELKTRKGTSESTVEVLGYYTEGDGGGGNFYWDNTSTETDNGGTIISVSTVSTGRWKRQYNDFFEIIWFGFIESNSISVNTNILNSLILYARTLSIKKIKIHAGTFVLNAITSYVDIELEGNGADKTYLKCNTDITEFITINDSVHNGVALGRSGVCLSKLKILGNTNLSNPYVNVVSNILTNYHPATALVIDGSKITFSEISINGFNKATKFKSNTYIVKFVNFDISFNNYAIHFDKTGFVTSGERISFDDGTIGNNNYGVYNKGGMLHIHNTSIDYSYIKILENYELNPLSGSNESVIHVTSSHIEGVISDRVIINESNLNIVSTNLWNEGYSASNNGYIYNLGNLSLTNIHLRFFNPSYLIEGNEPNYCQITSFSTNNNVQFIHKNYNLFNISYTRNTLTNFSVLNGSCTLDSVIKRLNSKSIKITSNEYGTGFIVSNKIKPVKNKMFISAYINGLECATGTNYLDIKTYNLANTLLSTISITTAIVNGVDSWIYAKSGWLTIPEDCAYFTISIQTVGSGISPARSIYIDDLFVSYEGGYINNFI